MRDKIALVTGGASGIGQAAVRGFSERGAKLVIADIADDAGQALAKEIEAGGGSAVYMHADMTLEDHVARVMAEIGEKFGRLDIAFNNVGYSWGRGLEDITSDDWDRTIALSLKAPWLCIKHEAPIMTKSGGGCIVNTASMAGVRYSVHSSAAYASAKAGVLHLTTYAANHLAAANIRVNAVSPGLTLTPAIEKHFPNEKQQVSFAGDFQLIPRGVKPEEIAAAVIWLCSDEAKMVTGENICVAGGAQAK